MLNVFMKKSAEELHTQIYDGRMMPLEDLGRDKDDIQAVSKLQVGVWFLIDREVIDKNKEYIRRKCNEAGDEGKKYWKRFEASNTIADENPDQYPRLIETYIFEHRWIYKTEQEMRDMCEEVGDGMCDEVICDFELQMRICNGESATDLFKKADKLPCVRAIKRRNGLTNYLGGGDDYHRSPADIYSDLCEVNDYYYKSTPYAFRTTLNTVSSYLNRSKTKLKGK